MRAPRLYSGSRTRSPARRSTPPRSARPAPNRRARSRRRSAVRREPFVQLCHACHAAARPAGTQALFRVRAVSHGERIDTCRARHVHVMRRVANHERILRRHVQLFHQLAQHRWRRLGLGLVGTARCPEIRPQASGIQRAIQAAPRFAGGDTEHAPRAQCYEQLAHAAEESHLILARAEVLAVAPDELGGARGRELRYRGAQRVVQPEPDDMARLLHRGHLECQVRSRVADALGDGRGRIDDRAVPVEHQQPVPHSRAANAAMSAGSGASSRSRSPVRGCANARRPACSINRFTPCLASSRLSAKSPYLSSPSTGWPAWARCTRIWCVRPVRRRTCSRLWPPPLFFTVILVSALLPPSWTLTR